MRAVRPLVRRTLSAGTIVALVTAGGLAAGPSAASALPPRKPCGETACERTDTKEWFTFEISRSRWSVAAAQGRVSGGTDLNLWSQSGTHLKESPTVDGTDWIAIDNTPQRRPTGTHHLRVDLSVPRGAPTVLWVLFFTGHGDLLQQRASTIGDPNGTWLVDVRDVRLQAGEMLGLSTHGEDIGVISVLAGDPTRPASWIQTPSNAAATFYVPKEETPGQVHNFAFTAPSTGTYGLVFQPRGWWSRGSTVDAAIIG